MERCQQEANSCVCVWGGVNFLTLKYIIEVSIRIQRFRQDPEPYSWFFSDNRAGKYLSDRSLLPWGN